MFSNLRMDQVFIACGPTDLRKSVDGLAAIVQESFQLDPFSSHLFVFCNRKKDKLKILHWDHNGFWLFDAYFFSTNVKCSKPWYHWIFAVLVCYSIVFQEKYCDWSHCLFIIITKHACIGTLHDL